MARRRGGARAGADRLLTLALVVLSVAVGAFLSSILYRWTAGPGEPAAAPRAAPPSPTSGSERARIRVEVLNGTRVAGLADRVTDLLRRQGFDVVNYGNAARRPQPASAILDRVGNPAFAREVALALPGTPIRSEPSPDGFVDVTVLVGGDYPRFFARAGEAVGRARGPLARAADWLRARLGDGAEDPPEGGDGAR